VQGCPSARIAALACGDGIMNPPLGQDGTTTAGRLGGSEPSRVVGIGMSAGGLEPLKLLLSSLAPSTGMAFVCVPHLAPQQPSQLPQILARCTSMNVQQAERGARITGNTVYVIPPGVGLEIRDSHFHFKPRRPEQRVHHAVDTFLGSLAMSHGTRAVGVLLSGTGTDGSVGLAAVKSAGGITMVQDHGAQHGEMPRSAERAGHADFVLDPEAIARELTRISASPAADEVEEPPSTMAKVLERVFEVTGTDFSNYKRSTLHRRVVRRMTLTRCDSLGSYLDLLEKDPQEAEALRQDVLIGVTSFYRDAECFEALKEKVFRPLTAQRPRQEPVRVWVLGCSTGEEAYSIAMAFSEHLEETGRAHDLQLFATDVNESAIERARTGIYPRDIEADLGPERLQRHFFQVDGSYRVSKQLRDWCIFACHDAVRDPPFSRMDLIACRNLLIYLDPVLQQRLAQSFHHALRPGGVLWTGSSESMGGFRDLFETLDAPHRLFVRSAAPPRSALSRWQGLATARAVVGPSRETARARSPMPDAQRQAEAILLDRFAPPSLVVSADLDILQFRGDTSRYLAPAPGKASLNLIKMLREGLLLGVRAAILRAQKDGRPSRAERLRIHDQTGAAEVNVDVVPLRGDAEQGESLLVMFDEPGRRSASASPHGDDANADPPAAPEQAGELARLSQELIATREYLESLITETEGANAQLQSANEEIQSANEELQSINEELETSKEEIQSSNEELATVNDELQDRNAELSTINDDLVNLLASVQLPIVMLGRNLSIRRFTPMAGKLLNLIPGDVGRPIQDIRLSLQGFDDAEAVLCEVMRSTKPFEREVLAARDRWHLLRIRPYRTAEEVVEGAVLVLVDIDALKRGQVELARHAELLAQAREPILMWRFDGGEITFWNAGAEDVYGWTSSEALGRPVHELLRIAGDPSRHRAALEISGSWKGELLQCRRDGQPLVVESRMALCAADHGRLVIETARDVTERKRMEQALVDRAQQLLEADRLKNEFLGMLAHELRNPLAPLLNVAEMLKRRPDAPVEPLRGVIERQVRRMARMVDDLLDVTRVTQGKVHLRRSLVSLGAAVDQAAEMVRPAIAARRQCLRIERPDEDFTVDADSMRLEQVFANLLDNASKFSPEGGTIRLSLSLESARPANDGRADRVVVRVTDDGIGIAPEMLPRVFDMFTQVHQHGDRSGGLGIGLTLVRSLVEMQGGSIDVFSDGLGRGTEVTIRLPVVRSPEPKILPPVEPSAVVGPLRVLVVDDNVDAAVTSAQLLELGGHEVRVAHDGRAALEVAAELLPQAAILDIDLPDMDGYELARRLRNQTPDSRPFLVAVTGHGNQADRLAVEPDTFDEVLSKPVGADTLSGLLARHAARGDRRRA
jgi:two-component system, chemotaxis family, CheB/CheR fusion protein